MTDGIQDKEENFVRAITYQTHGGITDVQSWSVLAGLQGMAYDADAMTLVIAEAAGLDPDDKGDRQVIDLILDEYYWIIISGLDVAEMNIEVGKQQISERNGAYLLYNDLKRAGVFEVTADGPVVGGGKDRKPKSVGDIINNAVLGRETKGHTTQYIKSGDYGQAVKEFEALNPLSVKNISTSYGQGKTGILPDGRTITVRPGSTDGRPTLEIRNPNGRGIEIRYGE